MQGDPFFRRVPPRKADGVRKLTVKRKLLGSKLKSAILRKSNKNAEMNESAKQSGNKEIADFILRKRGAGRFLPKVQDLRESGGSKPPPYKFFHR